MGLSGRRDPVVDLRILPYQKRKETYEMDGKCLNCHKTFQLRIAVGELAPAKGLSRRAATCPSCGCSELVVA